MRGRLASDCVFFTYNLVIYTLLACTKQASHTHTHTCTHTVTHTHTHCGSQLSGECIVTRMLKNKIIDGMTVQMYETLYSRSLHGTHRTFRLPVWMQPPFRLAASWRSLQCSVSTDVRMPLPCVNPLTQPAGQCFTCFFCGFFCCTLSRL